MFIFWLLANVQTKTEVIDFKGKPLPALSTPQNTVTYFIERAQARDFDGAAHFLDLSQTPKSDHRRKINQLRTLLDRTLWVDKTKLSNDPGGDLADTLPDYKERVAVIYGRSNKPHIIDLVRQKSETGDFRWKFSSHTLRQLDGIYQDLGIGEFEEFLPSFLVETQFLFLRLWQWIGLSILIILALLCAILTNFLWIILAKLFFPQNELKDAFLKLKPPIRTFMAILCFSIGIRYLSLSIPAFTFIRGLERSLLLLIAIWFGFRAIDGYALKLDAKIQNHSVLPLARKGLKGLLVLFTFFMVLQNFGVNVTALLAGLGVGGLAVALAGQKTIENLFGGIVLILDEPIKVGDYCKYGQQTGFIEEIGIRSTRIRTLDRTLITIPNSDFSQMQIENFRKRDRIRLETIIGLTYDTTASDLKDCLSAFETLIRNHPDCDSSYIRVRFIEFGDFSLKIEIVTYILTQELEVFLKIKEELFFLFMEEVKKRGLSFAFPTQTLHITPKT